MDIRKDYKRLYEHWLQEFQQTGITPLDQETFSYYKKSIDFINNYKEEAKGDIQKQILATYKDNMNFLFNDLFKMRENKIINASLALKEINLDNTIEAEKLLYQNLIRSIKGYNQVKALSIFEELEDLKGEELKEYLNEKGAETGKEKILIEDIAPNKIELVSKESKEDYKYILVRFIRETEPLVGIDLINYGPFKKEDIANLPYENAKILLSEKFAEKIDLS